MSNTPISPIALLALFSGYGWSQTPTQSVASLAGQQLIFPKAGDQSKVKLKKSQLNRLKGNCDVAVLVKDADWKAGTVRLKLQNIGTASVLNQPRGSCPIWRDEILVELSDLAPAEPAGSLLSSVHQVLQTPEEYLAGKGISFSLPSGAGDETPATPPPPVIHPKPLLRVDGGYTDAARSAKIKGTVTMRLIVGTDGRAHNIRLLRGLGFGLDESAIRVLSLWRFEPARQMDKPVAVQSTIEMHFNIM